ncbi:MAG: TonB-dependent receptor [Acidobacteriota bacterium]
MSKTILALFVSLSLAGAAGAATVRGSVVDAASGAAVAGARVEILENHQEAVTGTDGGFAVSAPEAGQLTLVVSCPGFRVFKATFPAPPEAPLEIRLAPQVSYTDRIEVTASRAREGVDAASFTNISRERIDESYWGQDPAVLLADLAPGAYAYNDSGNGIGYSYFTIRGFGQARARVTLNGAPLNDAESGELFFIDLADFLATAGDIQVRRGVFGLSGIGGAVDITTAPPEVDPSFTLLSGAGSFNTRRFTASFGSGLIDGAWALTARYSKISSDGYRDQSWVDMWNYYLALARYGDHSSLRLVLFGGPERTHLAYAGVPHDVLDCGHTGEAGHDRRHNPLTYPGEIDSFTQPHFQLIHQLALASHTQLEQTFYLFEGDGYYDQLRLNRKLAEYNLPNVVLPDGTVIKRSDLIRRRNVNEWDAGWVPALTHTSGPWTLSAGGEVRTHHAHHWGEVRWAQHYPTGVAPNRRYYDYQVEKLTLAAAASAALRVGERLSLTAGLQATRHRYEMSRDRLKEVTFDDSFDFLLPRLGAIWRLATGTEAYFALARGMREPAFRTLYDPQDYYGQRVALDPEDVWDLEAGVSLRRAVWRARANLFFMRFANEIVYAGALDDNGVPIYGNGARSLHRGLELDATWTLSPRLGLDAALTLSRNTFTRYREHSWDGGVERYDGNRIAGYPDLLASATARTEIGGLRLALTVRRVGHFYLDSSEDNRRHPERRLAPGYVALENPAFTLVDLGTRAQAPAALPRALGLDRLEVDLRFSNLFDAEYTAFGYVEDGAPLFIPAAGRSVYVGLELGL